MGSGCPIIKEEELSNRNRVKMIDGAPRMVYLLSLGPEKEVSE
jgi:hypothetical protein